jgi:nicotinic acid phosphoribosyltransferase
MFYVKIIRGDALKKLHEDQINNSTPDAMMQEIKSKMIPRGAKAFTTLICQFQSVDEFYSKDIDYAAFETALGYFRNFHLSDTQLKKLFAHQAKNTKMINYMNFAKDIAGPPNDKRIKAAKDIL